MTFGRLIGITACALGLLLVAPQARAQLLSEMKIGALMHDVRLLGTHKESGSDVNGELLFSPTPFLKFLGSPRAHIGFMVNTEGNTNQLFYGGFTWTWDFLPRVFFKEDGLFIAGSLGGGVNDGYRDGKDTPNGRKALGSNVLFRESVELGYRLTRRVSLSAYLDHISNAGLANNNEGITNIGGRIGYKF